MKRMNLKKTISLVSFLLLMVFGLQAQNMNSETALVTIRIELENLQSLNQGAEAPTASNEAAIVTAYKINFLKDLAESIPKYGVTTSMNNLYSMYTANMSGSRMEIMIGVKQDAITLLTE